MRLNTTTPGVRTPSGKQETGSDAQNHQRLLQTWRQLEKKSKKIARIYVKVAENISLQGRVQWNAKIAKLGHTENAPE